MPASFAKPFPEVPLPPDFREIIDKVNTDLIHLRYSHVYTIKMLRKLIHAVYSSKSEAIDTLIEAENYLKGFANYTTIEPNSIKFNGKKEILDLLEYVIDDWKNEYPGGMTREKIEEKYYNQFFED